jgi:PAS domain S-box-containing protein
MAASFLPAGALAWTESAEPLADFEPGEPLGSLFDAAGAKSWAFVPLLEKNVVRGGMILATATAEFFDETLMSLLAQVTGQLQAALLQAELEREVEEQTANLKAIIGSLSDALLEVTADHVVLQANSAARELLGLSSAPSRAESWDALVPLFDLHSGAQATEHHPIQRAFVEARTQPASQWALERADQPTYVSVTAAPIVDDHTRRVRAVVLVVRDITEQRVQEQKLLAAEKHASMSTLAAGVAHEFKNYLGGIMGNASLAQRRAADRTALGLALQRILDIGERANQTALALLSYVRDTNQESQRVDVAGLLAEVICLTEQRATKQGIRTEQLFNARVCVQGVPAKLRQTILNLIQNALEAMPDGGTLTLTLSSAAEQARLTIADTGVGIPPEHLGKVFDPFFSTKGVWGEQAGDGSGLGLTTSLNTIREHGGDLTLTSRPGEGTTVAITLPCVPCSAAPPAFDCTTVARRTAAVIEADPRARDLLVQTLERHGWRVCSCANAEELRDQVVTLDPALVLLDTQMPGKISFVRAFETTRDICPTSRIVVTTGESTDYQLDEYVRKADGRLVKPLTVESVEALIVPRGPGTTVPA